MFFGVRTLTLVAALVACGGKTTSTEDPIDDADTDADSDSDADADSDADSDADVDADTDADADTDPTGDTGTTPTTESVCDDQVDADLDGLTDCLDPDCAAAAACVPVCPHGVVNVVPTTVSQSTLGLPDVFSDPVCGMGASDFTFEFVAPQEGAYRFDSTGSSFDTVLRWWTGCPPVGTPIDCVDLPLPDPEAFNLIMAEGDSVLVIVDGTDVTQSGDFMVNIELQP